jgi:type II secretory pathway pseudopilin PulG
MSSALQKKSITRSRRSRRAGFTMIEVLVSLGLLIIILPAVMRGLSVSVWSASKAQHLAEAASLSQSMMNELVTSADPSSFGNSGDFGDAYPGYTWTMQNNYRSELLLTEYTLTVHWKEKGADQTFNVSTFLADPFVSATAAT